MSRRKSGDANSQMRGCIGGFVLGCIILCGLYDKCSCSDDSDSSRDKYEVRNDAFDNSVWQVERYLKKNLRDPDSYEGIAWSKVVKDGDTYSVRHKYRAKNRLGGYNIVEARFKIDEYGNVIDCTVISEY